MRIERTAKTVIAGLMSVACLASVAACGPGSSSNKANTETEAVSTDLGDTKYELKLWDGAGLKTFDDQLIEAFQKKYPNITIKATYDPDNTSQQNGPRIISAADTPDIARITDINSAVRGNHVVNLDAYADAYGWKLPDSQTQVYRVGSDGKIGSGSLYAVPDGVSTVSYTHLPDGLLQLPDGHGPDPHRLHLRPKVGRRWSHARRCEVVQLHPSLLRFSAEGGFSHIAYSRTGPLVAPGSTATGTVV